MVVCLPGRHDFCPGESGEMDTANIPEAKADSLGTPPGRPLEEATENVGTPLGRSFEAAWSQDNMIFAATPKQGNRSRYKEASFAHNVPEERSCKSTPRGEDQIEAATREGQSYGSEEERYTSSEELDKSVGGNGKGVVGAHASSPVFLQSRRQIRWALLESEQQIDEIRQSNEGRNLISQGERADICPICSCRLLYQELYATNDEQLSNSTMSLEGSSEAHSSENKNGGGRSSSPLEELPNDGCVAGFSMKCLMVKALAPSCAEYPDIEGQGALRNNHDEQCGQKVDADDDETTHQISNCAMVPPFCKNCEAYILFESDDAVVRHKMLANLEKLTKLSHSSSEHKKEDAEPGKVEDGGDRKVRPLLKGSILIVTTEGSASQLGDLESVAEHSQDRSESVNGSARTNSGRARPFDWGHRLHHDVSMSQSLESSVGNISSYQEHCCFRIWRQTPALERRLLQSNSMVSYGSDGQYHHSRLLENETYGTSDESGIYVISEESYRTSGDYTENSRRIPPGDSGTFDSGTFSGSDGRCRQRDLLGVSEESTLHGRSDESSRTSGNYTYNSPRHFSFDEETVHYRDDQYSESMWAGKPPNVAIEEKCMSGLSETCNERYEPYHGGARVIEDRVTQRLERDRYDGVFEITEISSLGDNDRSHPYENDRSSVEGCHDATLNEIKCCEHNIQSGSGTLSGGDSGGVCMASSDKPSTVRIESKAICTGEKDEKTSKEEQEVPGPFGNPHGIQYNVSSVSHAIGATDTGKGDQNATSHSLEKCGDKVGSPVFGDRQASQEEPEPRISTIPLLGPSGGEGRDEPPTSNSIGVKQTSKEEQEVPNIAQGENESQGGDEAMAKGVIGIKTEDEAIELSVENQRNDANKQRQETMHWHLSPSAHASGGVGRKSEDEQAEVMSMERQIKETSTSKEEEELLMHYHRKRSVATKVIGVKLMAGYVLTNMQCKSCQMPLMEYEGALECVVCPAVHRKAKKTAAHKRSAHIADREKLPIKDDVESDDDSPAINVAASEPELWKSENGHAVNSSKNLNSAEHSGTEVEPSVPNDGASDKHICDSTNEFDARQSLRSSERDLACTHSDSNTTHTALMKRGAGCESSVVYRYGIDAVKQWVGGTITLCSGGGDIDEIMPTIGTEGSGIQGVPHNVPTQYKPPNDTINASDVQIRKEVGTFERRKEGSDEADSTTYHTQPLSPSSGVIAERLHNTHSESYVIQEPPEKAPIEGTQETNISLSEVCHTHHASTDSCVNDHSIDLNGTGKGISDPLAGVTLSGIIPIVTSEDFGSPDTQQKVRGGEGGCQHNVEQSDSSGVVRMKIDNVEEDVRADAENSSTENGYKFEQMREEGKKDFSHRDEPTACDFEMGEGHTTIVPEKARRQLSTQYSEQDRACASNGSSNDRIQHHREEEIPLSGINIDDTNVKICRKLMSGWSLVNAPCSRCKGALMKSPSEVVECICCTTVETVETDECKQASPQSAKKTLSSIATPEIDQDERRGGKNGSGPSEFDPMTLASPPWAEGQRTTAMATPPETIDQILKRIRDIEIEFGDLVPSASNMTLPTYEGAYSPLDQKDVVDTNSDRWGPEMYTNSLLSCSNGVSSLRGVSLISKDEEDHHMGDLGGENTDVAHKMSRLLRGDASESCKVPDTKCVVDSERTIGTETATVVPCCIWDIPCDNDERTSPIYPVPTPAQCCARKRIDLAMSESDAKSPTTDGLRTEEVASKADQRLSDLLLEPVKPFFRDESADIAAKLLIGWTLLDSPPCEECYSPMMSMPHSQTPACVNSSCLRCVCSSEPKPVSGLNTQYDLESEALDESTYSMFENDPEVLELQKKAFELLHAEKAQPEPGSRTEEQRPVWEGKDSRCGLTNVRFLRPSPEGLEFDHGDDEISHLTETVDTREFQSFKSSPIFDIFGRTAEVDATNQSSARTGRIPVKNWRPSPEGLEEDSVSRLTDFDLSEMHERPENNPGGVSEDSSRASAQSVTSVASDAMSAIAQRMREAQERLDTFIDVDDDAGTGSNELESQLDLAALIQRLSSATRAVEELEASLNIPGARDF